VQNLTNLVNVAVRPGRKVAIAVMAAACALCGPANQAQVLKGSQPGATKLPGVQLRERLKALQGPGRTSPMIANPNASQHDNSSIIVVCKNQKLAADREVQEIQMKLRAMGDGSHGAPGRSDTASKGSFGSPIYRSDAASKASEKCGQNCGQAAGGATSGNQPAGTQPTGPLTKSASSNTAISGNSTISGNKSAPQTEMRKAGGDPGSKVGVSEYQRQAIGNPAGSSGVPQGPMKTTSASGNQGPGGANASVVVQPCQPTITTISGFPTAIFSPSSLFNPYTIKGCGFGNQMGNVYLTGPFNAGKIKLQVQTTAGSQKAPARASWSDTSIIVTVDPQLSGEVLQQNVTLVVEPVGGAPIQKAGNKFLPAYEDVMLGQIPKSAVKFSQPGSVGSGKGSVISAPSLSVVAPDLLYFSPAQVPKGMTAEVWRGGTTSFFAASTDYFDFSGLAQGFWVVSLQLHQEADPTGCDPGSESFDGSWNTQWESNGNIRVTWKEFRCLYSKLSPDPAVWSDYALNVMVKGPRGIDPWTGRRLLSLSPTMAPALAH
jgi:hypothetical protein